MNIYIKVALVSMFFVNTVYAEETAGSGDGPLVKITRSVSHVDIKDEKGKMVRIQRNQDTKNKIKDSFSKTSRKCPPFCRSEEHTSELQSR